MKEISEMWVRSLSQEAPLEEGLATHSSILAWRIPWTGDPGRLQSMGLQRADMIEQLHFLEYIILSEQNQAEKDRYHMISLLCGYKNKISYKQTYRTVQ